MLGTTDGTTDSVVDGVVLGSTLGTLLGMELGNNEGVDDGSVDGTTLKALTHPLPFLHTRRVLESAMKNLLRLVLIMGFTATLHVISLKDKIWNFGLRC